VGDKRGSIMTILMIMVETVIAVVVIMTMNAMIRVVVLTHLLNSHETQESAHISVD
jgi:hypothetical protein